MSVKCSIVCNGAFHIFLQSNEGTICIDDVDGPRDNYTGAVVIGHEVLEDVYQQLKDYFESGARYKPRDEK